MSERLKEAEELARQARVAVLAGDQALAGKMRKAFEAIFDELEAKLSFFASVDSNSSAESTESGENKQS